MYGVVFILIRPRGSIYVVLMFFLEGKRKTVPAFLNRYTLVCTQITVYDDGPSRNTSHMHATFFPDLYG